MTRIVTNNHYARQRELYEIFRKAFDDYGRTEDEAIVANTKFHNLTTTMQIAFSCLSAAEQSRVDAQIQSDRDDMNEMKREMGKRIDRAVDETKCVLRSCVDALESLLTSPTDETVIKDARSKLSAMQQSLEWLGPDPAEKERRKKIEKLIKKI